MDLELFVHEVHPAGVGEPPDDQSLMADTGELGETIVQVWIQDLNFDSDDEEIVDFDDNDSSEGLPLPALSGRTVSDYPPDSHDLPPQQAATLAAEEQADDRFVRSLAPSTDCFDFNWNNDSNTLTGAREVFTGHPGPTFPVTDHMNPVDIFYKMFNEEFLTLLVDETNRYADQTVTKLKQDPSVKKKARVLRWKPTDKDEMVTYLAVIILQGLYPKVKEEAYFRFDGFGTTPYFGRIMNYGRYLSLNAFVHFVDSAATKDYTKLNKIRPVIDYLNRQFAGLYTPGREVALDESLLKSHGHLSFSQKIASRAAKVGVKIYELCEASSGYLWAFRVYTGEDGANRRTGTQPGHRHDDTQDGHDRAGPAHNTLDNGEARPNNATAKIVYDLVKPLFHRGHTLIMDNFYNSPLLARCLKKSKTDVFGTLRLTRESVPVELKIMAKSNLRKGEAVAFYCSDLAVMLWHDGNFVSLLSTYHPLQFGTSKKKHERVQYKPTVVLDYNKYMGGVDRKDQFLAGQPLERVKNKVWYKKLFRRLYNAALFNCFVIFTSNAAHKISHREFRTVLAESLLKIHKQVDLKVASQLVLPKLMKTTQAQFAKRPFVEANHFPIKTGSTATRCWMCTRNKQQSRTAYKCEECDVNLCVIGCFKAYHKPGLTD